MKGLKKNSMAAVNFRVRLMFYRFSDSRCRHPRNSVYERAKKNEGNEGFRFVILERLGVFALTHSLESLFNI